jgi:hypothetical protein
MILFAVVFLSCLGMSVILASWNEFGSILFLSMSWKSLRSVGDSSSLKVQWNLAVTPSGPELFFVRRHFIFNFNACRSV